MGHLNNMPYLTDDRKYEIEKVCDLEHTAHYLASKETSEFAGAINYVNFLILKRRTQVQDGQFKRYYQFAVWVGTMLCCILEGYRRLIAPYEDEAIKKNGDVE
jgi:hypothetical protein